MNSRVLVPGSSSPAEAPQSRTGIRHLYFVAVVLSLLSIGFVVAIILVCRHLYLHNALTG